MTPVNPTTPDLVRPSAVFGLLRLRSQNNVAAPDWFGVTALSAFGAVQNTSVNRIC